MKAKVDISMMNRAEAEKYAKDPKNRMVVAVPLLLVASFIFYVLAAFFSSLGGGAASSSLEDGMLAGVSDYNAADSFQKISMAIRIMPSHNTEGNMLIMTPQTGEAEWQGEYDSTFMDSIT